MAKAEIKSKKIGFFEDDWLRLLKVRYNIIAKKLNEASEQLSHEEQNRLYSELTNLNNEINFLDLD